MVQLRGVFCIPNVRNYLDPVESYIAKYLSMAIEHVKICLTLRRMGQTDNLPA